MWRSFEASWLLRLAGAAMLTAAGWRLGGGKRRELRRRVRLLRSLAGGLGRMGDELDSLHSPIPLILERLQDRPFFGELARQFGAAPLPELWKSAAAALELPEEDRLVLSSLGDVVGCFDARRQAAELDLARRALERSARAAEAECSGSARCFSSLGAALGALLAVLLI